MNRIMEGMEQKAVKIQNPKEGRGREERRMEGGGIVLWRKKMGTSPRHARRVLLGGRVKEAEGCSERRCHSYQARSREDPQEGVPHLQAEIVPSVVLDY